MCLSIHDKQKDFWAKGLYNGGTREVRERSGVFIIYDFMYTSQQLITLNHILIGIYQHMVIFTKGSVDQFKGTNRGVHEKLMTQIFN